MANHPVRESRHLWVGGLPDEIDEGGINDYFSKFGKIEGVKILPQKYPNLGVAAFIDFYDVRSAIKAKDTKHVLNNCELRTNFKSKPTEKYDYNAKWRQEGGPPAVAEKTVDESASSSSSSGSSSSSSSSSSDSDDAAAPAVSCSKKARKKDPSSLLVKVTGLAHRPERVIQDGLYYEFTRYSPAAVVKMYGESPDNLWAVVKFKKAEECRTACQQSQGMSLFGSKIKLTPLDKDDFPTGGRDHSFVRPSGVAGGGGRGGGGHPYFSEDLDPSATRSLFVGNIPKNISVYELRDIFQRYGNVLDVEIKKMTGNATYGFVLFYDLMCAVTAKQYLDGENVHGNNLRVGFGKGTASKTIWVDGIDPSMPEPQLERHMSKHGEVVRIGIDRQRWCAMVQYDSSENAKEALNSVKGTFIGSSRRLMTDFANRDARAAFFSRLDSEREGLGPPHRSFPGPGMYSPGMLGPRGGGGGGGVMMVRPGLHMMSGGAGLGRGGGGFHPHRPPMDYYYQPYMEDMSYYGGGGGGGRPPFHPGRGEGPGGIRRYSQGYGHYDEGYEDFDEELRAFSRKREREKAREKHKKKRSRSSSSDSEGSGESAPHQKKKVSRDKHRKTSRKDKEKEKPLKSEEESEEQEEGEGGHGETRLKATQKARELRDRLKKKAHKPIAVKHQEEEEEEEERGERVKASPSPSDDHDSPISKKSDKPKGGKGHGSPSEERLKKAPTPKKPHTPPSSPELQPPKQKVKRTVSISPDREFITKSHVTSEEEEVEEVEEEEESSGKRKADSPRNVTSPPEDMSGQINAVEQQDTPLPPPSPPQLRSPSPSFTPAIMLESDDASCNVPETPQSPPVQSSLEPRKTNLESDLSSGEDFRESETEPTRVRSPIGSMQSLVPPKPRPSSDTEDIHEQRRKVKSSQRDKPTSKAHTPDPAELEPAKNQDRPLWRERPAPHGEDSDRDVSEHESSRKPAKLPRRYQISEEVEPMRRELKHREVKEHKRHHHLVPASPSPPPSFVSHRRRHYHSPPPPDYGERRWHRKGRPYSPGPHTHRRSSPGYAPSPPPPPYRGRSPISGSPPPRPRTPIQRPRDRGVPRYRYNSPPYEQSRGKFSHNMRCSPPSLPHHRHFSPSPPPRTRSPGRRHMRHASPPPSSPPPPSRRSPLPPPRWRERSRSADSSSPPLHGNEDRYPRYSKRPVFSRTPSPKARHRDAGREEFPESKRRKVEKLRPKSPSESPPPKEEAKSVTTNAPAIVGTNTPSPVTAAGGGSSGQSRVEPPGGLLPLKPQQSRHRQTELAHGGTPQPLEPAQQANTPQQQTNNLLDLLRRYPVMWQGHLFIKNDAAAVQLHFLSGNVQLAKLSLPQAVEQRTPNLRISQRMRLENSQLEGVDRRMQNEGEHCLLLALPCGRDANDVRTQTHALKNSLISYLLQKKAAGIINIQITPQSGFVLHIFPPCPFSQTHLSRVAPDLLSSASDNCHLMIVVATM